ncbi:MAG: DUF2799 domain-containing protein [Candidatus Thiodiazotropha endolucinida]
MIRHLVHITVLFSLAGCATMDKDECRVADWYVIGYEDGAKGHSLSYLGNHRKACANHGIAPDSELYEQGRLAGLNEYCTPQNGFELGKSGSKFNPVCLPPLTKAFKQAWQDGREVYDAKSKLLASERRLKQQQKLVDTLYQQFKDSEARLISDGISSKQRRALLAEVKELSDELDIAEVKLTELQDRVTHERNNLLEVEERYRY